MRPESAAAAFPAVRDELKGDDDDELDDDFERDDDDDD
jgi:hypothetical protein